MLEEAAVAMDACTALLAVLAASSSENVAHIRETIRIALARAVDAQRALILAFHEELEIEA